MNSLASTLVQFPLAFELGVLALAMPTFDEEVSFLLGAALTVLGMLFNWQVPRQRMSAEEGVKDGKLTEAQAARAIRFYAISAPMLTLAGGAFMIWSLVRYLG